MTHSIPKDTVNVSLNLPREERAILGRLATARDMSIGSLLRRLYLQSLLAEDAEAANAIRDARQARRARVLLGCGLGHVGVALASRARAAWNRHRKAAKEVVL